MVLGAAIEGVLQVREHSALPKGPEGRMPNVSPAREGWVSVVLDVSPGGARSH
jgi:hypothetical protein